MAKILIVEDQLDTQALLKHYLTGTGHMVSCANTAQTALEQFLNADFELVLLDYLLPDGDGLALLKHLKASKPDLPVLMLTASQDGHLLEQAFRDGAIDFLRKPFLRSELLARVSNVLSSAAQYRQLNEMYQALNRDLQLAGRVQRLFLPIKPTESGLDCAWLYQPLDGVSGDGLGLREVKPGYYVFYLVDVSGHGIQSAILMSAIKTCFDSLLETAHHHQPWQLAAALNWRMDALFDRHYATMLIGSLETSSGELRLFNAGHPPPVQLSQNQVKALTGTGSRPLGLQPLITESGQQQHYLQPGDQLLLYSDGLFEAEDSGFEDFLTTLQHQDWSQLTCSELCIQLQQLPACGKDDLTVMAIGLKALDYKQQLPADFAAVEAVFDQLTDWLALQKLEADLTEAIRLCWLEYGNNLVRHGKPSSPVQLRARRTAHQIELFICDDGPDWRLKPVEKIQAQADSGRGLWMIQQLSQAFSVTQKDGFNHAQILFTLPGGPRCLSAN